MEIQTNRFNFIISNSTGYKFLRYEFFQLEDEKGNKHIKRSHIIKTKFKDEILAIMISNQGKYPASLNILVKKNFDVNMLDNELCDQYKRKYEPFDDIKILLLLASLSKKDENLHNLSGKIWQVSSLGTKNKKVLFRYKFYKGILSQTVETMYHKNEFEPKELIDYQKYDVYYQIDGLHITLANKNDKDVFLNRRPKKHNDSKSEVTFLELDDFGEKYYKCKTHYYHKFLETIQKQLSEVITFEPTVQMFSVYNGKRIFTDKISTMHIQDSIVNSIYRVINKTSINYKVIFDNIKKHISESGYFINQEANLQEAKIVSLNKLNLRVVYAKKYYKNKNTKDHHKNYSNTSVQHLVLDELQNKFDGNKSSYGRITLIDVHIKSDIVKREINLIKYGLQNYENWLFILKAKNSKNQLSYHSLQIIHNAMFSDEYNPTDEELNSLDKYYCEGAIKINDQFIVIRDTDEVPMVNYETIEKYYKNIISTYYLEINKIVEVLRVMHAKATEKGKKAIDCCINKFDKYQMQTITPKETIEKIDSLSKVKLKTKFIKQFFKETGLLIAYPIDKHEMFATFEGINYIYETGKLRYYVAYRSINDIRFSKIAHAFRTKEVENLKPDQIDKYLELLQTNIVRINRDSIVPFQFKYLREYLKMNDLTPLSKSN